MLFGVACQMVCFCGGYIVSIYFNYFLLVWSSLAVATDSMYYFAKEKQGDITLFLNSNVTYALEISYNAPKRLAYQKTLFSSNFTVASITLSVPENDTSLRNVIFKWTTENATDCRCTISPVPFVNLCSTGEPHTKTLLAGKIPTKVYLFDATTTSSITAITQKSVNWLYDNGDGTCNMINGNLDVYQTGNFTDSTFVSGISQRFELFDTKESVDSKIFTIPIQCPPIPTCKVQ